MTGETEARGFLAQALQCRVEDVPADAGLGNPEGWDSIGHMRLVLALEERLGRALSAQEIVGLEGLPDVARLLGEAGR